MSNPTVTKYASVSNGTLANSNPNGLANSGAVNGSGTNNLTTNLMRSLLSSSNKSGNRSYFNHLSSSNNNNNNNMNTSNNSLNTNSTNNIFVDNDLSTYSLLPPDSYKNHNSSSYVNSNNSMITATMPIHQNTGYNALRGMQSREKTIAQLNQNITDRASRDSKINPMSNVRKENSFYANSKENNSNGNVSLINGKDKNYHHHHHNSQVPNSNSSHVDASSIVNSFFGNNSTISTNSQQQKVRSSNLNHSRSVLSSKQLNSQTPIVIHHKKDDCLTSAGKFNFFIQF